MIQIYIAFISFCILTLAADAISNKGTLYEFSNLMSVSLTEKEWLGDLLQRDTKGKYRESPLIHSCRYLIFDILLLKQPQFIVKPNVEIFLEQQCDLLCLYKKQN